MRIAFIIGNFPALSETFILNQITGLIDRGHDVDIYAIKARAENRVHGDITKYNILKNTHYALSIPNNKLLRVLKGLLLAAIVLPKNPKLLFNVLNIFEYGREAISLHFLYSIVPFVGRERYDIIHAHFGPNGIRAMKLLEIGAIHGKLITTFHGYDVNVLPNMYGSGYYSRLFQKLDGYTVSSNFIGKKVLSLGAPKEKLEKLPVGINLRRFIYPKRNHKDKKSTYILSVGRLVEVKGIEYSIRAIAELLPEFPNIIFKLAGEGDLKDDLETLIRSLGVSTNVHLLGEKSQEELKKLYGQADIFLLSSIRAADGAEEGQGVVLLEAQATGLPVVSTNVGGIPESIVNGKSGLLVPERDVSGLVEKLRYLILSPKIRNDMGRAGRTFVEENYNIDNLNDRLIEIYKRLIKN